MPLMSYPLRKLFTAEHMLIKIVIVFTIEKLYWDKISWGHFVSRRLRGQVIEVLKYLERFYIISPSGLFDYYFNVRTRNNEKKV